MEYSAHISNSHEPHKCLNQHKTLSTNMSIVDTSMPWINVLLKINTLHKTYMICSSIFSLKKLQYNYIIIQQTESVQVIQKLQNKYCH